MLVRSLIPYKTVCVVIDFDIGLRNLDLIMGCEAPREPEMDSLLMGWLFGLVVLAVAIKSAVLIAVPEGLSILCGGCVSMISASE